MNACPPFGEYVSTPPDRMRYYLFLALRFLGVVRLRLRRRSVVRFWLWRSATGNSADRSRHLSTDVVTPSLKRTNDLRSNPPRQARELSILVSSMHWNLAWQAPI